MTPNEYTSKSGLALPCKCRLCGKVIGHYLLEWPPPKNNAAQQTANEMRFGMFTKALVDHLMQNGREPNHAQALRAAITFGGNATTLFAARHFQLPDSARGFFEEVRQAVHETSRAFRMRDEDIEKLARAVYYRYSDLMARSEDAPFLKAITELLRNLRDQYEASPEPRQEQQPERSVIV